jgi:hypothetical protein
MRQTYLKRTPKRIERHILSFCTKSKGRLTRAKTYAPHGGKESKNNLGSGRQSCINTAN